jgi:hypothetical protein
MSYRSRTLGVKTASESDSNNHVSVRQIHAIGWAHDRTYNSRSAALFLMLRQFIKTHVVFTADVVGTGTASGADFGSVNPPVVRGTSYPVECTGLNTAFHAAPRS